MPASALILWLLLLWSLAPLAFPLSRRLWSLRGASAAGASEANWPDGGWAAGRALALVLWTLGVFWAGHGGLPVRFGWLLLLPAVAASVLAWALKWDEMRQTVRQKARGIAIVDGVFFAVFAAFFVLRCYWPDTGAGEKPMDIALAGACARADFLPPPNPYLGGERLGGYYYLGHLQTGLLTTTVGTELRWSYNLACATLPALGASLAIGLAAFLCGSWKRGAFASLIVFGLGTLEPLRQWLEPNDMGARAWPFGDWRVRPLDYFSTSRVIPNPISETSGVNYAINEFPFFTWTYGDLHAHFFAQPVALLAACLAVALFFNRRASDNDKPWIFVRALLTGAVLAALAVTNTWDVPAYWALAALCLFAPCRAREEGEDDAPRQAQVLEGASKSARRRQRRAELAAERGSQREAQREVRSGEQVLAGEAGGRGASTCLSRGALWPLLGAASALVVLLALPYIRNLHTNATPPTPLDLPATPPLSWLLMWGPFSLAWSLALWRGWREDGHFRFDARWLLLPVAAWLALRLAPAGGFSWNWLRPEAPGVPYPVTYSWGPTFSGADYFAPIVLTMLLALSVRGAFRSRNARFALLCRLAVCGLVPLLWSELTWAGFLGRSLNGGTFHRQDTVFKFGLQGWMLLGTAAACASLSPWRSRDADAKTEAGAGGEQVLARRGERDLAGWRVWPWPLRIGFALSLLVAASASMACVYGRARFFKNFEPNDAWAHLAPPEREAASWLQERARDGDTLLEAEQKEGGDYTPYGRYTHATGVAGLVGPSAHTFQWGAGKKDAGATWDVVNARKAAARAFFQSGGQVLRSPASREEWKRRIGLRFVVLGELERQEYGAPNIDALVAAAPATRAFGAPGDEHRVVIVDLK